MTFTTTIVADSLVPPEVESATNPCDCITCCGCERCALAYSHAVATHTGLHALTGPVEIFLHREPIRQTISLNNSAPAPVLATPGRG